MLQGALHIHSTYSDGELTLAELRTLYVAAGCRFACVTDHAEALDASRLDAYRRDCDEQSDDRFRFIAGLEYACRGRMHVLGYGVTDPIDSTDPQEVIRAIAALGGIAVVAHPKDTMFPAIEAFEPLPHGIEVWNSKYDGRYAPRPGTFRLLARLRARRRDVGAFYGQDFHWRRQYRGLLTIVDGDTLGRAPVLAALAAGRYVGVKDGRTLPSTGTLPPAQLAAFERVHQRSQRVRRFVGTVKSWADASGLDVPAPIKTSCGASSESACAGPCSLPRTGGTRRALPDGRDPGVARREDSLADPQVARPSEALAGLLDVPDRRLPHARRQVAGGECRRDGGGRRFVSARNGRRPTCRRPGARGSSAAM